MCSISSNPSCDPSHNAPSYIGVAVPSWLVLDLHLSWIFNTGTCCPTPKHCCLSMPCFRPMSHWLGGRPGVAWEPSHEARALRPGCLAVPGGRQANRRDPAAAWAVEEGRRGQASRGFDLWVHVLVLPRDYRPRGRESRGRFDGIGSGSCFFLRRFVAAGSSQAHGGRAWVGCWQRCRRWCRCWR